MLIRIAIDGPGGAGKSTIAKMVAKQLNLDYIDTGAMYRAIGYKTTIMDVEPVESEKLLAMLKATDVECRGEQVFLDGKDVSLVIRTPEIDKAASKISAIAAVRQKLVSLQRSMGQNKNVVMDGRDIGTNVLKDAEVKIFLTASPQERARRRHQQLLEKGQKADFQKVLADINHRDHEDMTREIDPLCKAEDAIELDTTDMSIEEVVDTIVKEAEKWL